MMEPIILTKNFDAIKVIDVYESFIWTERYSKAGDFSLVMSVTSEILAAFMEGYYIYLEESDRLMFIETAKITTDSSNGNKLTVTGRSLESILDKRIVWTQTTLDGYLEGQIQKLLNQNIISPSDSARQISNFVFQSSGDSAIAAMRIQAQYTGDNLYDILLTVCEDRGLGYKVAYDDTTGQFKFKFYAGKDRTYDQAVNEPVIFSPNMDNLMDSEYTSNSVSYKTIALVMGEDEGTSRRNTSVSIDDTATGLERRELYVDARDIQSENGDTTISDADYMALLEQRGREKLSKYAVTTAFNGSMETNLSYVFGVDFTLGDIVQVENEYGLSTKCRVTELIRSMKSSGYYEYPTFETVE